MAKKPAECEPKGMKHSGKEEKMESAAGHKKEMKGKMAPLFTKGKKK